MPIDLEMLMSASAHTFVPYPIYEAYSSYADNAYDRSLSEPQHHCVPRQFDKHQQLFHRKSFSELFINCISSDLRHRFVTNATRKKKVSFADDKGLKLVEVREIPKAPKWADDVITLLMGNTKHSVVKEKKWKLAFANPPSSNDQLIEKLEKNKVALEYVSVKEGTDDMLFATIKVKNLAFEKEIFLRVTYDRWQTHVDIPCTYIPSEMPQSMCEYDTFGFNTKILPIANRYEVIEFSVCFRCGGREYWDNNGDINYRLVVECSKSSASDMHQATIPKPIKPMHQCTAHGKDEMGEMDIWNKIMLSASY